MVRLDKTDKIAAVVSVSVDLEVKMLQIETYSEKYKDEMISLILDIQNNEAKIDLSLEEQPDLLDIRSQKIGLALYQELLQFAKAAGVLHIILDTPSVAHASHRFYEKAGFRRIDKSELPVLYSYPDRESILYMLEL